MPKQVELTPEARNVLERATIEPMWVFLPTGKLDPPIYKAVDKFLIALGGRWNKSKQGHHFPAGTEKVGEAIREGMATDVKRTLEQFFTPADIADQVVALAQIGPQHRVLEPSAGDGALIEAIAKAHPTAIIHALEIDPVLIERLTQKFTLRATIAQGDFLHVEMQPTFDRVVMNPPFGKGGDMTHVTRAFRLLRPGGILAAIMSPHWTFAEGPVAIRFRGFVNDHSHDWTQLPDGSFRASGTDVKTGILVLRKGEI